MDDDSLFQKAAQLWEVIRTGNCIAWIGSGLSTSAGYPGWPQAIEALCDACRVERLPVSSPISDEWVRKAMDKADECKQANLDEYHRTLANLFGTLGEQTRRAYELIVKLPFKGFVTTNFDPLLADAGARNGVYPLHVHPELPPAVLGDGDKHIFYMHGYAVDRTNRPSGENLVFARSEFDSAYSEDSPLKIFLAQLLFYFPIIFFASALSEPDLRAVFGNVAGILCRLGGKPKPRLMLMAPPREEINEQVNRDNPGGQEDAARPKPDPLRRVRDLGIEPVTYEPADYKRQFEIEQILEHLWDLAEIKRHPTRIDSFYRSIET